MLGSRGGNTVTQCVITAFTAALTAMFCAQYLGAHEDSETANECKRLRAELENMTVKHSIMKSRITDHFSLLCVLDSIDTEIPEGWFPPASCGAGAAVGEVVSPVCKVVFGMAVGSVLLLYVLKQLFGSGAYATGISTSNHAIVAIIASFIVFGALGFCSTVAGACNNSRKRQDRALRKLTRAYEKSQISYEKMVDSAERYNTLPEDVKYHIKTSEYLSAVVKEKILSGTFTEKSAAEVRKKACACYAEEIAICA